MNQKRYFSGARHYWIIEGEARFLLEEGLNRDPLAKQRIDFKEQSLSEIMVRLADADLKIQIALQAQEKYEKVKEAIFSAEVSLESSLVADVIAKNLLEVAEVISELLLRLRKSIPATRCPLFKIPKKILKQTGQEFKDIYAQSRAFLFPALDERGDEKLQDSHFQALADRLEKLSEPIEAFRDKVIAHKYDPKRFETHLGFDQYCEIMTEFKFVLSALSIVGALFFDGWPKTCTETEIARVSEWLSKGLVSTAVHTRGTPPL
jgi:hypothetical protein